MEQQKRQNSTKTLRNDIDKGGLNITHLISYAKNLKLKWIKKYKDPKCQSKWKRIWINKIRKTNTEDMYEYNIKDTNKSQAKDTGLSSINETLKIWQEINYKSEMEIDNPAYQNLWLNDCIKQGNKQLYNKEWCTKGIKYVHQLYKDGNLIPFNTLNRSYRLENQTFLQWYNIIQCIFLIRSLRES